jgi:small-conductance mechanosensitive channel
MDFLNRTFYENSLKTWAVAILVAILTLLIIALAKKFILRRLHSFSQKTKTSVDDLLTELIAKTKFFFLLVLSLYAAIWGNTVITFSIQQYSKKRMEQDAASVTTITALGFVGKVILFSFVLILALDNLGFNITTLVAGLGVSGIAIALAVQHI